MQAMLDAESDEATREKLLRAYGYGLRNFAWWQDGVEMVGTCGVTLKEAIEDASKLLD